LYLWHKCIGNRWSVIAKVVKGRSDNAIKNYWNSNMKKRIKYYLRKYEDVVAIIKREEAQSRTQ